jgi:hypothetical protein
MKLQLRVLAVASVAGLLLCGGVEAAKLPKPARLIDKNTTSWSTGVHGLRNTKYAKPTWGNRWEQSLGKAPIIVHPSVRQP